MRKQNGLMFLFTAALLSMPAFAAGQQMLTPEPISADAPTAQRSREFADLALAGDRQKVEDYLNDYGAENLLQSAELRTNLDQLMETLKTGPRTVVRMDGLGPNRVASAMGNAPDAQPTRALIVTMEAAAPHKIISFQIVNIMN